MNKLAKYLLNNLLCLILFFFFLTITFLIIELFQYEFDPSICGFKNLYTLIMKYSNIYYALILIITIYLALFHYKAIKEERHDRLKIAQGEFMLTLRKMFSIHDEIHFKFRGNTGDWVNGIPDKDKINSNYAKIDSYLGLFELCFHLIKRDLINKDEFNTLYGYRLENLFGNDSINERMLSVNKTTQ